MCVCTFLSLLNHDQTIKVKVSSHCQRPWPSSGTSLLCLTFFSFLPLPVSPSPLDTLYFGWVYSPTKSKQNQNKIKKQKNKKVEGSMARAVHSEEVKTVFQRRAHEQVLLEKEREKALAKQAEEDKKAEAAAAAAAAAKQAAKQVAKKS